MPRKTPAGGAVIRQVQQTFVSTKRAAEMLGYSHRSGTVQRLIDEGLIQAEQGPGHGLLVYIDSVQSYLEHHLKGRHGPGRPRGPAH